MNLNFNQGLAKSYKSKSQIIRVLSEKWVEKNSYCPSCGSDKLIRFENSKPVADLFCDSCNEEFELKSKKSKIGNIINDGAYETMISRINEANNPSFFFLSYSEQLRVNNFLIIPKYFFTPKIIIKRKPLANTAKRAGWVGCNINLSAIPEAGKVYLVKDECIFDREKVIQQFGQMLFLDKKTITNRGWLLDVLYCVDKLGEEFSLKEVYAFSNHLSEIHPKNNNVMPKIRQQLQILRDKGVIEFLGAGKYRKINCD